MRNWVLAANITGLIPSLILFVLYGFRTDWWKSWIGRVMFSLITVSCLNYILTCLVMFFPDTFKEGTAGEVPRIIARFAISMILWSLLFIFARAQGSVRNGKHRE